jgi:hypothetical protein
MDIFLLLNDMAMNKLMKMFWSERVKFLFVLLCAVFANFEMAAQDEPTFDVNFRLTIKSGDLRDAVITITKNGAPYRVIDPKGGYTTINLDLNAEFLFTSTKMGYISKSIVFDTHVPAGRETEEFAKFKALVELNKQPEGQMVNYNQPVGRIKFNPQTNDFDYDKDYSATAEAMQRKAEANPIPAPKPPTPNPRPTTEVKAPPPLPPSKPIPVEVKQPEYKPEPPKPKVKETPPPPPPKVSNKDKNEQIITEPRRKLTLIAVTIDGVVYNYRKEEYAWGGIYFYKDGKNITERTFLKETE